MPHFNERSTPPQEFIRGQFIYCQHGSTPQGITTGRVYEVREFIPSSNSERPHWNMVRLCNFDGNVNSNRRLFANRFVPVFNTDGSISSSILSHKKPIIKHSIQTTHIEIE